MDSFVLPPWLVPAASTVPSRITETIGYCLAHATPADPARSIRTPSFGGVSLYLPSESHTSGGLNLDDPQVLQHRRVEVVARIAERRKRASSGGRGVVHAFDGLHGGRLLAYLPDLMMRDGLAQAHSEGLFDIENCPGWDTWVYYFVDPTAVENQGAAGAWRSEFLIAWIPPVLLSLAERGVDSNPERSIMWLDAIAVESPAVMLLLRALGIAS